MTKFDIVVLLLCIPMFLSCERPTPMIKQAMLQEQKAIIELRIQRRKTLQERVLACDHSFTIGSYLRCEHCGVAPNNFAHGQFGGGK